MSTEMQIDERLLRRRRLVEDAARAEQEAAVSLSGTGSSPLGVFIEGDASQLSDIAIERIRLFNERFGWLPEICSGDGYSSLDYERWILDNAGIHIFMRNSDGAVLRANVGDGADMRDTPDHPSVSWILKDYGRPEGEELPANYYL